MTTPPLKHTSGSTKAASSAVGTVVSHVMAENDKWLNNNFMMRDGQHRRNLSIRIYSCPKGTTWY